MVDLKLLAYIAIGFMVICLLYVALATIKRDQKTRNLQQKFAKERIEQAERFAKERIEQRFANERIEQIPDATEDTIATTVGKLCHRYPDKRIKVPLLTWDKHTPLSKITGVLGDRGVNKVVRLLKNSGFHAERFQGAFYGTSCESERDLCVIVGKSQNMCDDVDWGAINYELGNRARQQWEHTMEIVADMMQPPARTPPSLEYIQVSEIEC
jgi:hypothetical protein